MISFHKKTKITSITVYSRDKHCKYGIMNII